ncbi:putative alliinase, EGF-like domain, pyridoxal phosphate-dependent transferase, major [Helianthus annuus]|nr:putative alliinase, EGF-like domain, pyridoxal phosphate-dependent transferase, major [Helianthus annuus]KAJ0517304.1 putative alliinase, EGF-like domain, pyridoxal phosphate-dependent transferase, major [Helianthus annuus]KAJ0685314.1 putative alliinase, EGF-like domain, pyridoxal phosphate-dependent transferase, major [Helianthus annuus]KAJ0689218.1 putative alliinase, EGF-like domain, pyridoxal phosphate-dependent transferase, major [Helianthus annuus]
MNKMKKYYYGICFLISVAINILFSTYLYVGDGRWGENNQEISCRSSLTWSEKAASEAEAVAAISCSGHGRAFLDGSISYGQPVCECYGCYGGTDCSELSPGCAADANSGDPIYLEPFWMQNAADTTVVISGWHRMSYEYDDDPMMSTELDKYIRKLHSIAGNAITQDRYIVFGVGSSQLLSAAVYALSSEISSSPSNVLASIPFYHLYKDQTRFFNSENFLFRGDTSSWKSNNSTDNMDVIEFVTSPTNPGGELKKAVLGGKTIYDHAYFWPQFTPIPGPSDHDLMIFSLSKLTGHAGTRFGYIYNCVCSSRSFLLKIDFVLNNLYVDNRWAIIKDKDVYEKVLNYIYLANAGISKDTQLRVLKVLKVAIKEDGKPFFEFAYNKMKDRWDRLAFVFSNSTRFSIQQRHPLHCNFFHESRLPSPGNSMGKSGYLNKMLKYYNYIWFKTHKKKTLHDI